MPVPPDPRMLSAYDLKLMLEEAGATYEGVTDKEELIRRVLALPAYRQTGAGNDKKHQPPSPRPSAAAESKKTLPPSPRKQ